MINRILCILVVAVSLTGCAPTIARYVHPATQEIRECRKQEVVACTFCGVPILEGIGGIVDAIDAYQAGATYAECKSAAEQAGYERITP
jgi:hypothetical protein